MLRKECGTLFRIRKTSDFADEYLTTKTPSTYCHIFPLFVAESFNYQRRRYHVIFFLTSFTLAIFYFAIFICVIFLRHFYGANFPCRFYRCQFSFAIFSFAILICAIFSFSIFTCDIVSVVICPVPFFLYSLQPEKTVWQKTEDSLGCLWIWLTTLVA